MMTREGCGMKRSVRYLKTLSENLPLGIEKMDGKSQWRQFCPQDSNWAFPEYQGYCLGQPVRWDGSRVVQSVYCSPRPLVGWPTNWGSILRSVQTGSGAHTASHSVGTGRISPGIRVGWTERNHENFQSGLPVYRSRFEPTTSWIRIRSVTALS
jgi:hypothetical protein